MKLPLIATAVVAVAVAALAATIYAQLRTHHDGAAVQAEIVADAIPAFALRTADGRPFTQADLAGRVCLIYFGFTTCPDVCPTELGWMVRTMRQLGELGERVQPILVTIDPERDTPERLAAYASAFHPRMLALTGDASAIAGAAAAFGVTYRKQTPVSQQPGFYLLDHTMTTFVTDADGRIAHRISSHDVPPAAAATLIRPLVGGLR